MTANATVNLQSALALRDFGYQGDTIQRWVQYHSTGTNEDTWVSCPIGPNTHIMGLVVAVAAPDPLTALMWLEEEGFVNQWWRDASLNRREGPWGAEMRGRVDPNDDDSDSPVVRGDGPDALIAAIAEHHRQHAAAASQEPQEGRV